ncbi:hypothetical protein GIB67_003392 [Kingdonia uniflora]|uniref:CCHC-type domain-containing protein n=1 Tax=Kingdonia uniflora TaxID=39325 RepID=A0A7J7P9T5_9MAGN|nr:hypothetical protein GIB67_003392 [Kingdonia uniflora]
MFYTRVNSDGTTFSMRASSNLIHTCPGRSGQSNKNVNAQWVANEVEETIRAVETTRPTGVKELISRRRLKAKEWEEAGLVLVPRVQTHIDKMIKYYVASYVQTYKNTIYLVVDGSEWDKKIIFYLPPLVRGSGRPRKQRIPDLDEEKRHKRCGKCGDYGHNKKTCKGAPVTLRPSVARAPKRVDINVSMTRHMSGVGSPPITPNMRGRGSDGIGGGGGRSSRGARQTQDTEAPKSNQASHAPRQTRTSTQQVQSPRQTQSRETQSQTQAT